MKSLMDKPHMITSPYDRLIDDSIFEPIRLGIHRARHTRHPLLLLFLCTFLATIWFLFRR
jgi:hypothetical protein